jgi:hypothetical protein
MCWAVCWAIFWAATPGELGIPDPPGDWQELDQVIGGDGLGDVTGAGVGRVAAAG